jgi:KDO2-lipid IV(A) lauroyltransferase
MKAKIQKLSLFFFKLFRTTLKLLPEKVKMAIGRLLGFLFKLVSSKRKKITIDNLNKSNLKLDSNQIKSIVNSSYQNLGLTLVELLTIDTYNFEAVNPKVNYSNIDLINKALELDKGVILLSGHFGNWELLAYSAGVLLNKPLNVVVKYQMNPFTDKYLRNMRQRGGNVLLDMNKAGRKLISVLKSNGIIAMLADQRAPEKDSITLDFMGREARTFKAPATLALRLGSPIIVGFAVRDKNDNYTVNLVELDMSDLKNDDEGIRILTKRYLDLLEEYIKKYPSLWSWQHKRWQLK